ncbi:MAG: hypothetical protein QNK03_07000 [Myxococcota bacterium]|nr:hypothetical protein [Myxococcota bacterium]
MDLTDPTAFALDITDALRREGVEHALYGGLLLAAYGQPRETKDADLAVVRADATATSSLLERDLGLGCRVAFDGRRFGGLRISRITVIDGDELNTLDLVEPGDSDYAARAIERAPASVLRERPIRVLGPEDFVIFKVLSTRDLDIEDAAGVLRSLGADLDRALIEQEIELLSRPRPSHPVRERWAGVQARA